ncbi:MAG: lysoplasmalogenase [Acidobacteriota bacterium]|nr:lysoplasmalogenase [Blastocatellia bacterium]MDW8238870.1 lysoplasmalogenase [Acidobacteriota bacterium]
MADWQILIFVLALATATLTIRAEYVGPRYHIYIFKPLTTLLILLMAARIQQPVSRFYQQAICLGLVFSTIGDICLMLPSDRFVAGVASFLVAHLCYIVAFSPGVQFASSLSAVTLFMVVGVLLLSLLWPHLGKMKWPVLAYVLVIMTMAGQALARWIQLKPPGAWLALLGAVLFILSDAILAWSRFRRAYRPSRAVNLSTYYLAQWLIALSVGAG